MSYKATFFADTPATPNTVVLSGINAGDVLVALMISDAVLDNPVWPSGFSTVAQITTTTNSMDLFVGIKKAVGGETSIDFATDSSFDKVVVAVLVFNNIDAITQQDVTHVEASTDSNQASPFDQSGSITPVTNGCDVLALVGWDIFPGVDPGNTVTTVFSTTSGTLGSWTNRHEFNPPGAGDGASFFRGAFGTAVQSTAGPVTIKATGTAVPSANSARAMVLIALRPAIADPFYGDEVERPSWDEGEADDWWHDVGSEQSIRSLGPARYLITGGASVDWNSINSWSDSSGGPVGATVPVATQDVFMDAASGNGTVTINAATANCRNYNATGYIGTVSGSLGWNCFGDFKLGSGMTFSYTGSLTMKATGGATFTTSGKNFTAALTFDGVGGQFSLEDALNITHTDGVISLINGSFNANEKPVTFNAQNSGGGILGSLPITFADLTLIFASGATTDQFSLGTNVNVTGKLSITGLAPGTRPLLKSSAFGTQRTITAAAVALQDVDIQDIAGAGAATWTGTRLGDAKGNSGITFDAPKTSYYVGNSSQWNSNVWAATSGGSPAAANYPLPQDTAVFDANSFSANSQLVTGIQAARFGTVDFSAVTKTGIAWTPTVNTCYGNFVGNSGVAVNGTGATFTFSGRNTQTFLQNGATWQQSFKVDTPGGIVRLLAPLTISGGTTQSLALNSGTFDMNGQAVSAGIFGSSNAATRSITSGGATLTLTGNGATIWQVATATNLTLNDAIQVDCTYSGATGTRTITHGSTAVSGTEANSVNIKFSAGTDTVLLSTNTTAKNVDFTGFGGTWTASVWFIYGNLTIGAGTTVGTGATIATFKGTSGTKTIASNGKTMDFPVTFDGVGGTWKLADAMTLGATRATTLTNGTIDLNGQALTTGTLSGAGVTAKGIKSSAAGGILKLISTVASAIVLNVNATGTTLDRANWEVQVGGDTASMRQVTSGAGLAWPKLTFINATANGELDIAGSATWAAILVASPPQTIKFQAGATFTIDGMTPTGNFPRGTPGNLVTIDSITAATHSLVAVNNIVDTDYLSVKNSVATPGTLAWYAGSHSTNVSGNTGWIFGSSAGPQSEEVSWASEFYDEESEGDESWWHDPTGVDVQTESGTQLQPYDFDPESEAVGDDAAETDDQWTTDVGNISNGPVGDNATFLQYYGEDAEAPRWDEGEYDEWLAAEASTFAPVGPAATFIQFYGEEAERPLWDAAEESDRWWYDVGSNDLDTEYAAPIQPWDYDPEVEPGIIDSDVGNDEAWIVEVGANDFVSKEPGPLQPWDYDSEVEPGIIDADVGDEIAELPELYVGFEQAAQAPNPPQPYGIDVGAEDVAGNDQGEADDWWYTETPDEQVDEAPTPQQPYDDDPTARLGDDGAEVDDAWHAETPNEQVAQAKTPEQPREFSGDELTSDDEPDDWWTDVGSNDLVVYGVPPSGQVLDSDLVAEDEGEADEWWHLEGANDEVNVFVPPVPGQPGESDGAEWLGDDGLDDWWHDVGANDRWTPPPFAGIKTVQSWTYKDNPSASTGTNTLPQPPGAGNLVVCFVAITSSTTIALSDNFGDGVAWTQLTSSPASGTGVKCAGFYKLLGAPTGGATITATFGAATPSELFAAEYASQASSPLDGTAVSQTGLGNNASPGNITTTGPGVVVGFLVSATGQTAAAVGFTKQSETTSGIGRECAVEDRSTSVAGSYNPAWTNTGPFAALGVAFLGGPSPDTPPQPYEYEGADVGDDQGDADEWWHDVGANDLLVYGVPPAPPIFDHSVASELVSDEGETDDWWHAEGANDEVAQAATPPQPLDFDASVEAAGDDDVGDDSWFYEVGASELEEEAPTPQQPRESDGSEWLGDDAIEADDWFLDGAPNEQGPQAATPQQPREFSGEELTSDEGETDDWWHEEPGVNEEQPEAPTPQQPGEYDGTDGGDAQAEVDEWWHLVGSEDLLVYGVAPTQPRPDDWPEQYSLGDDDVAGGDEAMYFDQGNEEVPYALLRIRGKAADAAIGGATLSDAAIGGASSSNAPLGGATISEGI